MGKYVYLWLLQNSPDDSNLPYCQVDTFAKSITTTTKTHWIIQCCWELWRLIKVAQNYSCMASLLNWNAILSNSTTNSFLKGINLYKLYDNQSSQGNLNVQLYIEHEGIWKTK